MTSIQGKLFYWMFRLSKGRNPLLKNNLTVQQQRELIEEQSKRYNQPPEGVTLEAVKVGDLNAEWLRPATSALKDQAILFLHGGAFTMGSPATSRALAAFIATACQMPVLSLDYRLAPEHPFPAGVEDTLSAFHWLVASGIKPEHIAVIGESGGGGIVLEAVVALQDAGNPLPGAVVALSPVIDLSLSSESMHTRRERDPFVTPEWAQFHIQHYLNGQDPCSPKLSPLYADLHGWPTVLIQVGENEVLYNDALRFAEAAQKAHVSVCVDIGKGMWHGWQKFAPVVPEGQQAVDRIAAFIHQTFERTDLN